MKRNKRIILGSAIGFIVLICVQVFSTGHGHVVVVEENQELSTANKTLTKQNSGLKKSISTLEAKNEELVEDKAILEQTISDVASSLDSTKAVVKDIKKELSDEKAINILQSTGEQFDFEPIKLPASDDN
jgi:predicted RNase H-like nuclease (RuvC/YqgF family)